MFKSISRTSCVSFLFLVWSFLNQMIAGLKFIAMTRLALWIAVFFWMFTLVNLHSTAFELISDNELCRKDFFQKTLHFLMASNILLITCTVKVSSWEFIQMQGEEFDKTFFSEWLEKRSLDHYWCQLVCRSQTCSKTMPGSLGYELIDAKTFAEWVGLITSITYVGPYSYLGNHKLKWNMWFCAGHWLFEIW